MNGPTPLSSAANPESGLGFSALWETALGQVQRLAGDVWTDHNVHDPGITILEQLCYAMSDLAYRVDFDVQDLIAPAPNEKPADRVSLSPAEMMTTRPVTVTDLRKIVIDVPGVKNAWVEPAENLEPELFFDPTDQTLYIKKESHRERVLLRGIHRVLIAVDGTVPDLEVTRVVRARLHANRNLGEDFEPPVILQRQKIVVEADLEIGEVDDPALLLAQVYAAIAGHISPRIRFQTLAERLESGRALDEILRGPILDHGFIDTEELESFPRAQGIRTSDVIRVLMSLEGIRAVQDIVLVHGSNRENWYLALDISATPILDVETCLAKGLIRLRRGKVRLQPDEAAVREHLDQLLTLRASRRLEAGERDRLVPLGRARQLEKYYSFQHHLPRVYGVGQAGLPEGASQQAQAKVLQLKAYLLFFDQVLANCFSQVAHAKDLFANRTTETRTYFSQLPAGIPRAAEVLQPKFDASALQQLTERSEASWSRRDRFLNHLLARFGEGFADFSVLNDAERRIAAKAAFLADYAAGSAGRGCAFDYSQISWDKDNISGLERRIARKLGLVDCRRRALADLDPKSDGGLHLVEHVLLRPRKADMDQWQAGEDRHWRAFGFLAAPNAPDPYSAQISVVFPGWLERFKGPARNLVHRILVEEVPAHLRFRVLWLEREEMAAFEAAFRTWLESLVDLP